MAQKRVFISFDYGHDDDLRILLVGQARNPDPPFNLADWPVKEPMTGDWKGKVRTRIRSVDEMIVICGEYTHTASGVSAELAIAQEDRIPYFLLHGRNGRTCRKPQAATATDKIYDWTWPNLRSLIAGNR